ncbi:MAG TPA: hypothetical protein VG297_01610 [Bryobacteraceae bacterium]|jgi:hypothetical protein|nr:hypothetical protein [Bryobacteraceae bacterium]
MKSGLLLIAFAFAALAAAPAGPEVQAKVLDHNEYLCSNCFFGASTYYYCFEAGDKILIGYQKTPTLNWKDAASNDLTKAHKNWAVWTPEGQTVPLRFNEKNIWVNRPNGKSVKLKQDYTTDIFVNNRQCRAAVKPKSE